MRPIVIALALAVGVSLGSLPATAGLIGQTVTLNGTSAVIGSGVEFAGLDKDVSRAFTADFTDDGLNVFFAGSVPDSNGYYRSWAFQGASLNFSFATSPLLDVTYSGGNISTPAATAPRIDFQSCIYSPDSFCSSTSFMAVSPSFSSILDWTNSSIDLRIFPQSLLELPSQYASFRITSLSVPGATPAVEIVPIPEPSSAALLLMGVIGLACIHHRRQPRSAATIAA